MKQKIVIKVLTCKKCRSKAMRIAAETEGVISVGLEGKERDLVVVVGENVDAANLTCLLRKKTGHASIESVEEVKEKVVEKKKEEKKDTIQPPAIIYTPTYHPPPYATIVCDTYPSNNDTCSIM